VIGLLLPLWLNLESSAPTPTHSDAPEERYLACDRDARTMAVAEDERQVSVDPERRTFTC
jgi:hypothetical protein